MKITIPEQYREHFQGSVVHATRWKKPTLLLMNQKEVVEFQEILQGSRVCVKDGTTGNMKADIVELSFDGITLDIPLNAEKMLIGKDRRFSQCKADILLE